MKYDKFINYIGTISDEPSKYNLSIFEEIIYFVPTLILFELLILIFIIIAIPLLLAFSVYMIFYIVKQRHKARKSMKQNNKQKQ